MSRIDTGDLQLRQLPYTQMADHLVARDTALLPSTQNWSHYFFLKKKKKNSSSQFPISVCETINIQILETSLWVNFNIFSNENTTSILFIPSKNLFWFISVIFLYHPNSIKLSFNKSQIMLICLFWSLFFPMHITNRTD